MALDYASMERKLGEVDRARAILTHGAQFENPKRAPDYWKYWHEFEVGLCERPLCAAASAEPVNLSRLKKKKKSN